MDGKMNNIIIRKLRSFQIHLAELKKLGGRDIFQNTKTRYLPQKFPLEFILKHDP